MITEAGYSPDEVRRMIHRELMKSRQGTELTISQVNKLNDALSDDVLSMFEKSGLFNQTEIKKRIDNYRNQ